MRKKLDDTHVVDGSLGRNLVYWALSSSRFALLILSLISVATLTATLFPQGVGEEFHRSVPGERLIRIYDSLGLTRVLGSWWFFLLLILLFLSLVACSHARIREGRYRSAGGMRLYETEFSVPRNTEDIMLIFPVLLSSIGFTKKRIVQDEKLTEVIAERGIPAQLSSGVVHACLILLLIGLACTYLFSWGSSFHLKQGVPLRLPESRAETRWGAFSSGVFPRLKAKEKATRVTLELLQFTREYGPVPAGLQIAEWSGALPALSIPEGLIVERGPGETQLLRDWQSWVRVTRGSDTRVVRVSSGQSVEVLGLSVSQGYFAELARLATPAPQESVDVVLPGSISVGGTRVGVKRIHQSLVPESDADQPILRLGVPAQPAAGAGVANPVPDSVDAVVGHSVELAGVALEVLGVQYMSLIRVRSDPGRSLVLLSAFLLVLFLIVRLYIYSYALRVEIRSLRGGSSRFRIRMRSSGLTASPERVARRIAALLSK